MPNAFSFAFQGFLFAILVVSLTKPVNAQTDFEELFEIAEGQKKECLKMMESRIAGLKTVLARARKEKNFVTRDGLSIIGVKSKYEWIKAYEKYINEHEEALAQIRDGKRPPLMLTDLLDRTTLENFELIDMRAVVLITQIDDDGFVWGNPVSYMNASRAPYSVILEDFDMKRGIQQGQLAIVTGVGLLEKTEATYTLTDRDGRKSKSKDAAYVITCLGSGDEMMDEYSARISKK